MKRALGIVALVASVGLGTGCVGRGDGESGNAVPLPEDMPLCADQFQDGKTIEEADFGRACRTTTDELAVPRYVRLSCADDRTLVWNDQAWGYVGGPMQLFDANATIRMPTDEALACRQDATDSSIEGVVVDAP
ncbi:MAG: hypothetical protein ACRD2C_07805 [Acidimicrobiales bacterium]